MTNKERVEHVRTAIRDIQLPEFTCHDLWEVLKAECDSGGEGLVMRISIEVLAAKKRGELVQIGRKSVGEKQHCKLYRRCP